MDMNGLAYPKTAPVRLKGAKLAALRLACVTRDRGRCQECHRRVSDEAPPWHPLKFDMAHIKSRGANGADVLSNLRTLCHECHMKEHAKGRKNV